MRVRILMISDTAPPLYGGAGAQAALLAEYLRRAGHDVELFARQRLPVASAPPGTTFARPYLRGRTLSTVAFAIIVAVRVLFTRADIVHVHGGYAYAWGAIVTARLRRKPSILKVTLLESDDPAAVARWRFLGLPVGRVLVRQFSLASIVVAVNEEVRSAILRDAPQARVLVITNGVAPIDPDKRRTFAPVVCYTGAISRRKGIDTLLEAWSDVRRALPDARLRLIGPVDPDMAGQVAGTEALRSAGVTVEGLLPQAGARAAIAESAVFVLPSRHEGQPNALIEAMSAGLACCASDIPVNAATGGDAIVTFAVGDAMSLASALERTWHERDTLSVAARARAARFDIARVAERYAVLYVELAGRTL